MASITSWQNALGQKLDGGSGGLNPQSIPSKQVSGKKMSAGMPPEDIYADALMQMLLQNTGYGTGSAGGFAMKPAPKGSAGMMSPFNLPGQSPVPGPKNRNLDYGVINWF